MPTVSCAPYVAAYDYSPAQLLPPRTTPGGAVGPACRLDAAIGKGGDDDPKTQVVLAPVSARCASLDAMARGECKIVNGKAKQTVDDVVAAVDRVVRGALGVL